MGLFKEIYCTQCGKKTNLLTRSKLGDGHYLCSGCTAEIPSYIMSEIPSYSLEQYRDLMKYIEYSKKELSKKFKQNHSFHSIHIDTEHKLFYLDIGIFVEPLYLQFSEVSDFDLIFSPEEFKEGIIGDKVTGKILFKLKMDTPYFYYEKILATGVKAKAKKSFFGTEVKYENPSGMDDFELFFTLAWRDAVAEQLEDEESKFSYNTQESTSDELKQALALFMIDDLNNVSLNDIKEQRNRLIRTFHPDAGSTEDTKFAQKINAAYETIKEHLK